MQKLSFAILFLVFAALIFALNTQELTVQTNLLTNIISVNPESNLTNILPNYEYVYPISIKWNIPSDALSNINSNNVTIYVKATVEQIKGSVYFKDGDKISNVSYLILTCNLSKENNGVYCNEHSVLSKKMVLYIYSNDSSSEIKANVTISASLMPFEDFLPIYEQSLYLQKQLDNLISNLNSSSKEIQEMINETKEDLSSFHIESAKSNINKLNMQSGDLVFSLSFLFAQLFSQLQSLFNFILLDFAYSLAIFFALILFVLSFVLKLRKNGKYGIMLITILVIILSLFQLISAFVLIIIDIIILLMILAILFARKNNKKGFRSSDDFNMSEYNEILRKR